MPRLVAAATIAAAEQEGELVIQSTTDLRLAAALVDDFQALYPRIDVRYQDMGSADLYNGYLNDLATSPTTAAARNASAATTMSPLTHGSSSLRIDQAMAAAMSGPR